MSQKNQIRDTSIADADVKQKADDIVSKLTRDLAELASRKITKTEIDDLKTLITNFDDLPTDEELLGIVMNATIEKNNAADDIKKAIRPIRSMAEIVYQGVGKYASFGFEDMANMTENNLYRLAKRVVRVATKFLTELEPKGLTKAQIKDLEDKAKVFDEAIGTVEDKIDDRDIETQKRVMAVNSLWAKTSELADVGKSVYEDTNEAKYNDYVLMPSPTASTSTAPPTNTTN